MSDYLALVVEDDKDLAFAFSEVLQGATADLVLCKPISFGQMQDLGRYCESLI